MGLKDSPEMETDHRRTNQNESRGLLRKCPNKSMRELNRGPFQAPEHALLFPVAGKQPIMGKRQNRKSIHFVK